MDESNPAPEQSEPQPQLPEPDSEPVVPEVIPQPELTEPVIVPCAGCGTQYSFDIQPNTATFSFQCQQCGTRSEWARA